MLPLDEAQALVLAACPTRPGVEIPRREARWLVLAEDVRAAEDVPPFPNTAVDGYAVIAADVADVPVDLRIAGEIAAGAAPDCEVTPGTAVRIMTGAPMPPGADAVVMVEDSELIDESTVRLSASVPSGAAVRGAGEDVFGGDVVFTSGTTVTPAVEGMLATLNAQQVSVHPRLRVAVLSTGDELIDDGSPLELGQIRESNKTMLAGMVDEAHCDVVDFGIVPDDEAELERVLREAAATCDAIVTSGGVSMGDYDVVKAVLGKIADMTWMQIRIKPAKPFAFGTLDGVPVFGLPGNPVSSLVSFELLARPALRQMMGHHHPGRPSVQAVADVAFSRRSDGKTHFARVNGEFGSDGRYHVTPVGAQGSHQLAATATADAMAIVPDGDGIEAGDDIEVVFLHGDV